MVPNSETTIRSAWVFLLYVSLFRNLLLYVTSPETTPGSRCWVFSCDISEFDFSTRRSLMLHELQCPEITLVNIDLVSPSVKVKLWISDMPSNQWLYSLLPTEKRPGPFLSRVPCSQDGMEPEGQRSHRFLPSCTFLCFICSLFFPSIVLEELL